MHALGATAEGPGSAGAKDRGLVLDIGSGSGRDALHFLARGFRVRAVDSHAGALAELKTRADESGLGEKLSCEKRMVEELELEPASYDVINASMSLPFCPPSRFKETWEGIRGAL